MNINQLYPSTFLKAADLGTSHVSVTIAKVTLEDMGDNGKEMKPVLHFLHKDKGLVLNKTNGFLVGEAYGPETDAWIGKPLVLYSQKVQFQGRMVDGIAVMAVNNMQPQAPNPLIPQPAPVEQSAGHQPQPDPIGQAAQDLQDLQQDLNRSVPRETENPSPSTDTAKLQPGQDDLADLPF